MLDARKSAILRKVVTEHIETAEPVGSAHVVRDPLIDVSPATVRADMAALERDGYLTHPHTSAGRVPTDKGYRFFVDHLCATAPLDPAREGQVQDFFAKAHGELEKMLHDTSRLLSQLTDYAAVVVPPAHDVLAIRSSLLTRIGPRVALLVLVLSNGALDKHTIELDEDPDEVVERAAAQLAMQLGGQLLGQAPQAAPSGDAAVDALVERCLRQLVRAGRPGPSSDQIYVGGTARMAEQFVAVETVREVLAILEQSFVVVTLIRDVLSHGQQVSIGAENGVASLAECSLVVAPYEVDDEVVGTIGVLGPTRMNYPQALAAVAVVSERLGKQLTAG
jgi:heat-inducible transcriptional repressor